MEKHRTTASGTASKTKNSILTIQIPEHGNIISGAAETSLAALAEAVNKLLIGKKAHPQGHGSHAKQILVIECGSDFLYNEQRDDSKNGAPPKKKRDSPQWPQELDSGVLLGELTRRIHKFRRTLQKIRLFDTQTTQIVFAFNGDCLDWRFELAMACHYRFCYSSSSRFGFSEFDENTFPIGGFLENGGMENTPQNKNISKRGRKGLKRLKKHNWANEPIVDITLARSLGLMDFHGEIPAWRAYSIRWVEKYLICLGATPSRKTKSNLDGNSQLDIATRSPSLESARSSIAQLLDRRGLRRFSRIAGKSSLEMQTPNEGTPQSLGSEPGREKNKHHKNPKQEPTPPSNPPTNSADFHLSTMDWVIYQKWRSRLSMGEINSGTPTQILRLAKEMGKFNSSAEQERLICLLLAMQFYNPQYLQLRNQVEYRAARRPISMTTRRPPRTPNEIGGSLHVSVDTLPPPVEVLAHSLTAGNRIIFVSKDAERLISCLESYSVNLQKHIPQQLQEKTWLERISWYLGRLPGSHKRTMKWNFDDSLEISENHQNMTLIALGGSSFLGSVSVYEYPSHDTSDHLGPLDDFPIKAQNFGFSVIRTKPVGGNRIPVSIWIRSLLLDELMKLATKMNLSIDNTLRELEGEGWGFAASETEWSRFLHSRYSAWASLDKSSALVIKWGPSQKSWDLASWKQAKTGARSHRQDDVELNRVSASQHLGLYCGVLASELLDFGHFSSEDDANLLCAESFGFPQRFGRPTTFLAQKGIKWVQNYAKQWPVSLES